MRSRVTKETTLLAMLMELIALPLLTFGGGCGGSLASNYYAQCVTNMLYALKEYNYIFFAFLKFYFVSNKLLPGV